MSKPDAAAAVLSLFRASALAKTDHALFFYATHLHITGRRSDGR